MTEIPQPHQELDRDVEHKTDADELLRTLHTVFAADMSAKSTMMEMAPKPSEGFFAERRGLYEGLSALREDFSTLTNGMDILGLDARERRAIAQVQGQLDKGDISEVLAQKLISDIEADLDPSSKTKAKFSGLYYEAHDMIRSAEDDATLAEAYQRFITTMRPEFIDDVSARLGGYTDERPIAELIERSSSFNELLHLLHSYIENTDTLYEALPAWAEKRNELTGTWCRASGDETPFSQDLFSTVADRILDENEAFHEKLGYGFRLGHMGMVTVGESVYMMVRDAGHALMLNIDNSNPDKAIVRYHIPKITNVDLAKQLPGIGRVDARNSARGIFELDSDVASSAIAEFILSVPTDDDSVF